MTAKRNPSPIRIGILAAANVAHYALVEPAKRNGAVSVDAVASRDISRAQSFAQEYSIGKAYGSYCDLMEDPAIDLVYIATPPAFHAHLAISAMEAGKHVLVEKPLATNASDAEEMFAASARTGRYCFEAMHSLHHPVHVQLKEMVGSGSLGTIRSIDAGFTAPLANRLEGFRGSKALGGGVMLDLGIYPLAWIRNVLDEAIRIVRCDKHELHGVDASVDCRLHVGLAGCRIRASMMADKRSAWLTVVGDRGSVEILNPVAPQLGYQFVVKSGISERHEDGDRTSTFEAQLEAVVQTIAGGTPFPRDQNNTIAVLKTIEDIVGK